MAEYARELGVSPGHLHTAVKRTTGRPPGRWIRDRRILEAKRLIAATGPSPGEFRRALGAAGPSAP